MTNDTLTMKTIPILMPQMGQSMAEGRIIAWRKKVGDVVRADEVILEIESDKIGIEVESPVAGRLASCHKNEGDVAAVGDVVGLIESDADTVYASSSQKDIPHAGGTGDQVLVSASAAEDIGDALPEITRDWFSPYRLRLAMLNNVTIQELQSVRGTGRQGRLTRNDLLNDLSRRPYRVSMPSSVVALVRERVPGARRIEFCRTERHIVVRAGWEPTLATGLAREGDRVVALD